MEEDKSTKINSAFLEVKNTNLKGYERDDESKIRSIEKAANFSLGFSILGIVIRWIAPIISDPSGVLMKVASFAGTAMLGAALILAIGAIAYIFYYRQKLKFDFRNVVVTAALALIIALIYVALNFRLIIAEFMV